MNGDTLWQKNFQDTLRIYSPGCASSLIQTVEGNFVMTGSLNDTSNNVDPFLIKFDPNGDTIWLKIYSAPAFDNTNVVIQDHMDSGFILVGVTQSFGNGGSDFYMIKTDKNGNELWYKTYGGAGNEKGSIDGYLPGDDGDGRVRCRSSILPGPRWTGQRLHELVGWRGDLD